MNYVYFQKESSNSRKRELEPSLCYTKRDQSIHIELVSNLDIDDFIQHIYSLLFWNFFDLDKFAGQNAEGVL